MGEILAVLLELVFEALVQLVLDFLAEAGLESVRHATGRVRQAHPLVAAFGIVLLGGLIGAATVIVLPSRLVPRMPVPGLSLVLAPLFNGVVMHVYGDWRWRRGGRGSYLATFWGGSLFALAIAAVRFAVVR